MRIQHNIAALKSLHINQSHQFYLSKNLEKLASGYQINRAGDDAAGLAISEKMRGQISGLHMASKNALDGISLIQTAEGALGETHSLLQRIRELSVQAANDTNTTSDREKLQLEVDSLLKEVDNIANTTEFNTKKLLNGSTLNQQNPIILQIGANSNQTTPLALSGEATLKGLGLEQVLETPGTYVYDEVPVNFQYSIEINTFYVNNFFKLENGEIKYNEQEFKNANLIAFIEPISVLGKEQEYNDIMRIIRAEQSNIELDPPISLADKYDLYDFYRNYLLQNLDNQIRANSNGKLKFNISRGSYENFSDIKLSLQNSTFLSQGIYNEEQQGYEFEFVKGQKIIYKSEKFTTESAIKALGENALSTEIQNYINDKMNAMSLQIESHNEANPKLFDQHGNALKNNSYRFQRFSILADTSNDLGFTYIEGEGTTNSTISISTQQSANQSLSIIDNAISIVSGMRAQLGAYQNRLEHTINNVSMTAENLTAAESRLRDTDMAKEMMVFTKNNLLMQVSQTMMAQANQYPSQILKLLEAS